MRTLIWLLVTFTAAAALGWLLGSALDGCAVAALSTQPCG